MKAFIPPHEVDGVGYPVDPVMRQLEFRLGDLAYELDFGTQRPDDDIIKEYHETMQKLYDMGWDAILDLDAELPEELMPKEYVQRHPKLDRDWYLP